MRRKLLLSEGDFTKPDVSMKDMGEAWPRKHTETVALCDVDENGCENESEFGHESTPSDPDYTSSGVTTKIGREWPSAHKGKTAMGKQVGDDNLISEPQGTEESDPSDPDLTSSGITDKTGHDWPDKPKNDGGYSEPFGNSHRTDKGLKGGNIKKDTPPPKDGVPNINSMHNEEWSIDNIEDLMNEDGYDDDQLQTLFNSFARDHEYVCLEDFNQLLSAHGVNNLLDETGFLNLLNRNPEFTFHEQEDSDGVYWLAEGFPEFLKDKKKDKGKSKSFGKDDDTDDDEDEDSDKKSKKPAFLEGKPAFLKDVEDDDGDDGGGGGKKPSFLKGKGKDKGKKPSFLKDDTGEMDECDAVCQSKRKKKKVHEWIELARKVYITEQKGRISHDTAARALHISLNCSLDRDTIRGATVDERKRLNQFAKHYGIRFDEEIQRIAEGPFDLGGPGGPAGAPGAGMGYDPNDPNAAGMADEQEMMGGGPGTTPLAEPGVPPGLGGETMGGPAGAAGLGDPAMSGGLGGSLGAAPGVGAAPGAGGDPYGLDAGGPMGDNMGLGAAAGVDDWAQPGGAPGGVPGGAPGGGSGMASTDPGLGGVPGMQEDPGPSDLPGMDTAGLDMDPNMAGIGGPRSKGLGPGPRGRFENRQRRQRPIYEDYPKGNGYHGGTWTGEMKGVGHKMDHVEEASSLEKGKADKTDDLPQDDTETHEVKGKNLLGASQKNTVDPNTTAFTGGGCGILGSDGVKESLSRLSRYVRRYLAEHDLGLRGKFRLGFSTKLNGKRVSSKPDLPGILADAEELMLVHGSNVVLEAVYSDLRTGKALKRIDIPLPAVKSRAALVAENKVLFRFAKHAERFADLVMAEGKSCRISGHNYGSAVHCNLPSKKIQKIFGAIIK